MAKLWIYQQLLRFHEIEVAAFLMADSSVGRAPDC